MVTLTRIQVAILSVSTLTAAVPLSARAEKKSFSVNQVKVTPTKTTNPAAHYAKVLHKYGAEVPDHVLAAAAATGSVTTTPTEYDEEYLTPIDIGGTTMNLDIDTGSSDLWVFSNGLPSSETAGHAVYIPSADAELLSGYTWDISYGDGSSASGDVYLDYVNVGGVTATSQAVEAAETISSEFEQDASDGLMGLAFSSINTVQPVSQLTFFANIQSSLASPLFCADLKYEAPGVYDFGFIDSSKYTGSITYTSVDNSEGYWGFTASGYAIGSGSTVSTSISGIADTGTTLLLLSSSIVNKYYAKVSGATNSNTYGGWVFPCSATLPTFTTVINGYKAVIPAKYLNYAPVTTGSSTCFGSIQVDTGIGFAIFGDIFLKSQYVVFDASGPQLGFAAQA
ncbi:type I transmembrane sorting receptor [Penicillium canescens]|uniref:penicillopepsin n=1 Tax=Penicillium canescens TaxID=5083 RepID=A0AAD6IEL8_PENCN|nr:type I transmembrane sorting receptor [Penicillium canescens]KAJ6044027.1 type I transmembrane sorting receptor [Penicillium canescens]KAJ6055499.1 type I transmembrane sorting receptor [Penicillium canescens]KAJ6074446.1 type I transmembrane sorting receptor [Penicillium canescens]KAJ6081658.1 type I transmembrane sorting receptor [Penicillium canescens]KAJ6176543.1 type I transmembrane sorting receptor [Penicillium canescens]